MTSGSIERTSLLTAPPEGDAQKAANPTEQASVLAFQCFLGGYRDGDIGFEEMCRAAARVLAPVHETTRRLWLGQLVHEAIEIYPPPARRSRKGLPYVMRDVIRQVVDLVSSHEGLGKAKDGPLWSRVAEIFTELGVKQSASQIYRLYYPD